MSIMDSVEEYARRWTKSEGEELDTLSEWVKKYSKIIKIRYSSFVGMKCALFVFKKPEVTNEMCIDHMITLCWSQQVKKSNIVFVCKNYCYGCLLDELGFTSTCGNPTYTRTNITKDKSLQHHLSVLNTINLPKNQDKFELPYLYWIPK
jgi:hypothetical protein